MNKSESKYFNTSLLMDEALVALLEKKDFEYITVKEICEKAGVNRSTFYLHYETISDLMTECLEHFNKQFIDSFATTPNYFISDIDNAPLNDLVLIKTKFLKPYLSFIRDHRSLYRAAYKNPSCMQVDRQSENIYKNILRPIMKRFHIPEKDQAYLIAFYIHGVTAIIQEWVKGNCKDPVEEIETILIQCIRPQNGLQDNTVKE